MKNLGMHKTLGEAWLAVVKEIYKAGIKTIYTDNVDSFFEVKECFNLSVLIEEPILPDKIIDSYKDEKEYEWMVKNFTSLNPVKELNNASSYAERLYSYLNKKNQIEWVIKRLKDNPNQRSCAITTFEPLKDELYIPCVSMLDFQKRINEDVLDLNVYCRAIDFGSKGYVNMTMLATILKNVCDNTDLKIGKIDMIIKSAHYRIDDEERIQSILKRS